MLTLLVLALCSPVAAKASSFDLRATDWRNGPIVYQVFVDRFAPPISLESKRSTINGLRKLHPWSEAPKGGHYDPSLDAYTHEADFWGGDLRSLHSRLGYIQTLGADVLYLQPIFNSFTNHGYDTKDYYQVAPNLGTKADLNALTSAVHAAHMRIMLDGVFNHMGVRSSLFQGALKNPADPHREWFYFGNEFKRGYKIWGGAGSLVVAKLETKSLRDFLWNNPDSVVQSYLKEGIDGWRLDVAFELGPAYLTELTSRAHSVKPGSAIVGEISGYPSGWFPAVDGVFNFFPFKVLEQATAGKILGGDAGRMLNHMVEDAGIDNLLKSWLVLDNHDTARMASTFPEKWIRDQMRCLMFTMPGAPVIYYGSELGMAGLGDPENRAPMRWDLVTKTNPDLELTKELISIRKKHPALRYGDFKALDTHDLIAFSRTTDKVRESVIVVLNPSEKDLTETIPTRIGILMSWGLLNDLLSGTKYKSVNGLLQVDVPRHGTRILVPETAETNGYSPYDRIP